MFKLAVLVVGLFVFGQAYALRVGQTVEFDGGDMGCETYSTQAERLAALKARDLQRFADLSRKHCKRLTGPFQILEIRSISGGRVIRVGFGDSTLWVLQP